MILTGNSTFSCSIILQLCWSLFFKVNSLGSQAQQNMLTKTLADKQNTKKIAIWFNFEGYSMRSHAAGIGYFPTLLCLWCFQQVASQAGEASQEVTEATPPQPRPAASLLPKHFTLEWNIVQHLTNKITHCTPLFTILCSNVEKNQT